MIPKDKLFAHFSPVYGNPANLQGDMLQAFDLHRHFGGGGDTSRSRWHTLRILAGQGIDVAVTNHNQLGHSAASRTRDLIHRIGGRFVEIVDAVEITAKFHGQDRHVLVYNAPKPRKLKAFTPLPYLLAQVADQGGYAFLAHPELGVNMSVTQAEVETLVNQGLTFGLEVHNGGAVQIAAWSPFVEARADHPIYSFIRRRLPQIGSNDQAKEMATTYDLPANGGTDQHGGGESFVVTCASEGMPIFEAIKKGLSVVMESKTIPRPQPHELVIGTVGSKFSSWRMDRRVSRLQRRLVTV